MCMAPSSLSLNFYQIGDELSKEKIKCYYQTLKIRSGKQPPAKTFINNARVVNFRSDKTHENVCGHETKYLCFSLVSTLVLMNVDKLHQMIIA